MAAVEEADGGGEKILRRRRSTSDLDGDGGEAWKKELSPASRLHLRWGWIGARGLVGWPGLGLEWWYRAGRGGTGKPRHRDSESLPGGFKLLLLGARNLRYKLTEKKDGNYLIYINFTSTALESY